MAWKEKSVMSERVEFLRLAQEPDANISRLAKRFSISRKTAYKWLARVKVTSTTEPSTTPSVEPLTVPSVLPLELSRRPKSSPTRTADDVEKCILDVREKHPAWGGRKIHAYLKNKGRAVVPVASTITEILRRHGKLDGSRAGQPRDWQRFEHPSPNDLWQMDFKGHVAMTDGRRCHPLTIIDDYSRYAIGLVACHDETTETVQAALMRIFIRHGLPARMLMDNGSPWGDPGGNPYTRLTVWLMRLGVRVSHGRPYHPQTQGKDERFHRSLKAEVLDRHTLVNLAEAQRHLDDWREIYNHERPHEALDLKTPSTRYRTSPRDFPTTMPAIEYPSDHITRKVDVRGRFIYHGQRCQLSQAFHRMTVGLRTDDQGTIRVRFATHDLGRLDLTEGVVVRDVRPDSANPNGEKTPGVGDAT